ncbi:MAG TPA: ABC transporter ATP-binding protein [Allosphingosinicella sp.]|jgi:ABC-type polysaccharide/polyol phosphate transport system ATPase subunit|nr:ABC transporter ATP-binding protein [Allosphingosinicella sp.]
MSGVLLRAEGVSKKYSRNLRRSLAYSARDICADLLLRRPGRTDLRTGEFWAVDDLGVELRPGEALAVIGRNGSGKTTFLRMAAGLLKPDAGRIEVAGRLGALVELGAGLNPILTGRENLELGASLQEVHGRERGEFIARAIDFAGIDEALDAPLQSYSTGMRARLAFAIATQSRPDILLVDEVLAVGDHAFRRKCIQHMKRFLHDGGALILVSHNVHQIQAVCERALVLEDGRTVFAGSATGGVSHYLDAVADAGPGRASGRAPAFGPVRIAEIGISGGGEGGEIRSRGPLRIAVRYEADDAFDVVCGFGILTADESIPIAADCEIAGRRMAAGKGEIVCVVPDLPLLPGRYVVRASIGERETQQPLALLGFEDEGVAFHVRGDADIVTNSQIQSGQLIRVDASWER